MRHFHIGKSVYKSKTKLISFTCTIILAAFRFVCLSHVKLWTWHSSKQANQCVDPVCFFFFFFNRQSNLGCVDTLADKLLYHFLLLSSWNVGKCEKQVYQRVKELWFCILWSLISFLWFTFYLLFHFNIFIIQLLFQQLSISKRVCFLI